MLSAVALVVYTVQPAKLLKKYGSAIVTAWGMLIGGVILSILRKPWTQGVSIETPKNNTEHIVATTGSVQATKLDLVGPIKFTPDK